MSKVIRLETGEDRRSSTQPKGFFDMSDLIRLETGEESIRILRHEKARVLRINTRIRVTGFEKNFFISFF
jgi:hypothetical protein